VVVAICCFLPSMVFRWLAKVKLRWKAHSHRRVGRYKHAVGDSHAGRICFTSPWTFAYIFRNF
jgi:hypothetical protein